MPAMLGLPPRSPTIIDHRGMRPPRASGLERPGREGDLRVAARARRARQQAAVLVEQAIEHLAEHGERPICCDRLALRHRTGSLTMLTRIGVYPGTFDPITLGHLDIIRRGAPR
jgi:hypothetical protein